MIRTLHEILRDERAQRIAMCDKCDAVRGYWQSNGPGKNGIWVGSRRDCECGAKTSKTMHRRDFHGTLFVEKESDKGIQQ